jgi:hypothetical protein
LHFGLGIERKPRSDALGARSCSDSRRSRLSGSATLSAVINIFCYCYAQSFVLLNLNSKSNAMATKKKKATGKKSAKKKVAAPKKAPVKKKTAAKKVSVKKKAPVKKKADAKKVAVKKNVPLKKAMATKNSPLEKAKRIASFKLLKNTDPLQKQFVWPQLNCGDCVMQAGAIANIYSDGTGNFTANVSTNSTDSGDIWHQNLIFSDTGGNVVVTGAQANSIRMDAVGQEYYFYYTFTFEADLFGAMATCNLTCSC